MFAAASNCHNNLLNCHDSPFFAQCSSVAALDQPLATWYYTDIHLTAQCCCRI